MEARKGGREGRAKKQGAVAGCLFLALTVDNLEEQCDRYTRLVYLISVASP